MAVDIHGGLAPGWVDQATATGTHAFRPGLNPSLAWWGGVADCDLSDLSPAAIDAAGPTDNGPALFAALQALNGTGLKVRLDPSEGFGYYVSTSVQMDGLTDTGILLNEAVIVNDAVDPVSNRKRMLLPHHCTNVFIDGPGQIVAVKRGAFGVSDGLKRMAINFQGIIRNCGARKIRLTDHQQNCITYGSGWVNPTTGIADDATDPALHYFDGLYLDDITVDGDCGAVGDGAGINVFPQAQLDADTPASRSLYVRGFVSDVTRASTNTNDHGPANLKINNVRGVYLGSDMSIRGGSVAGVILDNGCQDVHWGGALCAEADTGYAIGAGHNTGSENTTISGGLFISGLKNKRPVGTAPNGRGMQIGQVLDLHLTDWEVEGSIVLINDRQATHTTKDWWIKDGKIRGGRLETINPARAINLTTTAGSDQVEATSGSFALGDVGATLSDNPNIPPGTTIVSRQSRTLATLSSGVGVLAGTGVATTILPIVVPLENLNIVNVTATRDGRTNQGRFQLGHPNYRIKNSTVRDLTAHEHEGDALALYGDDCTIDGIDSIDGNFGAATTYVGVDRGNRNEWRRLRVKGSPGAGLSEFNQIASGTTLSYEPPPSVAATYAASYQIDPTKGRHRAIALTGDINFSNPNDTQLIEGMEVLVTVTQDATGGRAVTWGSKFIVKSPVDTTPSVATTWRFLVRSLKLVEMASSIQPPVILSRYLAADLPLAATDTVLQDLTGLSFPVAASDVYEIEGELYYTSSTAGDLQIGAGIPSSPTIFKMSQQALSSSATGTSGNFRNDAAVSGAGLSAVAGLGAQRVSVRFTAFISNASNSGTFQMRAAQATSDPTAPVILSGSWMRARKL